MCLVGGAGGELLSCGVGSGGCGAPSPAWPGIWEVCLLSLAALSQFLHPVAAMSETRGAGKEPVGGKVGMGLWHLFTEQPWR